MTLNSSVMSWTWLKTHLLCLEYDIRFHSSVNWCPGHDGLTAVMFAMECYPQMLHVSETCNHVKRLFRVKMNTYILNRWLKLDRWTRLNRQLEWMKLIQPRRQEVLDNWVEKAMDDHYWKYIIYWARVRVGVFQVHSFYLNHFIWTRKSLKSCNLLSRAGGSQQNLFSYIRKEFTSINQFHPAKRNLASFHIIPKPLRIQLEYNILL